MNIYLISGILALLALLFGFMWIFREDIKRWCDRNRKRIIAIFTALTVSTAGGGLIIYDEWSTFLDTTSLEKNFESTITSSPSDISWK